MRAVVLAAWVAAMPCAVAVAAGDQPLDESSIPELISRLADDDPQVRGDAAEELDRFGVESKAAVPALVKILSDEETYKAKYGILPDPVCDAALRSLISISSESVAGLIGALDDPSPDVRRRAVYALGQIGPKARPALPRLLKMAAAGARELVWNLVQVLPRIDPREDEVVLFLIGRLQDDDPMVRQQAAISLVTSRDRVEITVPALLKTLSDKQPEVRGYAADALGQIARSPATVVPALVVLFADQAGYYDCWVCGNFGGVCDFNLVTNVSARAVGEFGTDAAPAGPALVARLVAHAEDYDAASALGKLGAAAEPFVGDLVKIIERPELSARERITILTTIRQLGRLARPAVPTLRKLLDQTGQNSDVHIAVACALVSIDVEGNPRAWQRLLTEMDRIQAGLDANSGDYGAGCDESSAESTDDDSEPAPNDSEEVEPDDSETPDKSARGNRSVRKVDDPMAELIFQTLGHLGQGAAPAVPRLIRLLERSDSIEIIVALGSIGPSAGDAVTAIVQHAERYGAHEKAVTALLEIGPDAIPALVESFTTPGLSESQALLLLKTLGRFDSRASAAIPILVRISHDPRRNVRAAAATTLGQIGASPEVIVPALVRLLADERPVVREQAALGLGNLEAEANPAVAALVVALKDEYIDVRTAAAQSLGDIGPAARAAVPMLMKASNDPSQIVQIAARHALKKLK